MSACIYTTLRQRRRGGRAGERSRPRSTATSSQIIFILSVAMTMTTSPLTGGAAAAVPGAAAPLTLSLLVNTLPWEVVETNIFPDLPDAALDDLYANAVDFCAQLRADGDGDTCTQVFALSLPSPSIFVFFVFFSSS